jgi:hypothetical protein
MPARVSVETARVEHERGRVTWIAASYGTRRIEAVLLLVPVVVETVVTKLGARATGEIERARRTTDQGSARVAEGAAIGTVEIVFVAELANAAHAVSTNCHGFIRTAV